MPQDQRRLDVELLETRQLLSNFAVTSTADDGSTGTLRWAVEQANAATTPSTIDFAWAAARPPSRDKRGSSC